MHVAVSLKGASPLRTLKPKVGVPKRVSRSRDVCVASFQVRPYTTRKGDTWDSIASKRGFNVDDLKKLNHSIDGSSLLGGTTIVLPADSLSARDKDIIDGMGRFTYRTYPVRKGETVDDIASKRGISMSALEKLNPDVELKKLKPNQILKLPAGKYSIREREMLEGSAGVPDEFFQSKGFLVSASVLGVALILTIITWLKEKSGND